MEKVLNEITKLEFEYSKFINVPKKIKVGFYRSDKKHKESNLSKMIFLLNILNDIKNEYTKENNNSSIGIYVNEKKFKINHMVCMILYICLKLSNIYNNNDIYLLNNIFEFYSKKEINFNKGKKEEIFMFMTRFNIKSFNEILNECKKKKNKSVGIYYNEEKKYIEKKMMKRILNIIVILKYSEISISDESEYGIFIEKKIYKIEKKLYEKIKKFVELDD